MPKVRLPDGMTLNFPDGTSEEVMRDAIYRNFPQYAPKDNLSNSVPDESTGFSGIVSDIGNSLSNAPSAIIDALTELPQQAYQSGKQILSSKFPRAIGNLGAGLLEGLKGAANIPSNIAGYLDKKDIGRGKLENFIKGLHIGDTGLQKAILGDEQEGDALLQAIGSFSPYARLGGLGKGANAIKKRAIAASAYGAGQNQDPLTTALVGLAGEGIGRVIKNSKNVRDSLRPSSPLSAEQLQEALNVTHGTETSLGRVLENPSLNKVYENILPNVIGSGAEESMQRTAKDIVGKGDSILRNLVGGDVATNYGPKLQEALKQAARSANESKNERFAIVNKIAQENNVTTDRSNLRQQANLLLNRIQSDPDLASFRSPADISLLERISNPSTNKRFSLQDSDYLRAEIGERRYDAFINGDTPKANLYRELQEAVEKDINEAIEKSDNQALKDARKSAMEFYKNEYAPFEEDSIVKFTRKGGDPDLMLSHFIRGGKNDRATILSKLSERLSQQQNQDKNLLASAYLSRAIDESGAVDPLKFRSLYKSLGKNQRKALFANEKTHEAIRRYSDLIGKNTEAFKLMLNPKTGARNTELISKLGQMGIGGLAGGVPGLIVTLVAGAVGGKAATKFMTSPKIREKLIQKMIEAKRNPKKKSANLEPFVQAIMSAQSGHKPLELELTEYNREER